MAVGTRVGNHQRLRNRILLLNLCTDTVLEKRNSSELENENDVGIFTDVIGQG